LLPANVTKTDDHDGWKTSIQTSYLVKQVSASLLLLLVVVGIKSCLTFSHVLDPYLYLCKGSVLFKLIESCRGVLISWVHHHVSSLCYTGAAVVVLVCLDSKLLDWQCFACPLELRDHTRSWGPPPHPRVILHL
jgi:hypothetical protein